ncbi:P27 family phage terminase small subunit [Mycobacterium malmoense]|uniref:P27 family phage terminase small subunit n=1 Tax=Mycobacterium malmoense TaxID=1780 RepID=UPI0009F6FAE2|nr:P27 family phage terminase small subunit [Mycobacterium malmoense]
MSVGELTISKGEFPPPRPLSLVARQVWDRNASRIHSEGRWHCIDQELLAVFCETLELYLRCREEIDNHGVLVQGRTERELVRNPALTPFNQARAHLLLLAPRIPLVNPKFDAAGIGIDHLIEELRSERPH